MDVIINKTRFIVYVNLLNIVFVNASNIQKDEHNLQRHVQFFLHLPEGTSLSTDMKEKIIIIYRILSMQHFEINHMIIKDCVLFIFI